jgi:APA family basic amino acid/polyamine antiporter
MSATGVGLCLLARMNLANWMLLAAWTAVGSLILVGCGYRHSALRRHG